MKVKCGVTWMPPGTWSIIHSHENFPKDAGPMLSSRLWVAAITRPKIPTQRTGIRTSDAIETMLQPRIQITPAAGQNRKVQAKSTIVISSKTSQSPRVRKKRDTCDTVFPRVVAKYAPVPAKNENVGAQK